MAEKKPKDRSENKPTINYPIKTVFQLSTLAGCVAFIMLYINKSADITTILFRSFLVFVGFSVAGRLLMVGFFSILLTNRQQEEEYLKEQEEKRERERRDMERRDEIQREESAQ